MASRNILQVLQCEYDDPLSTPRQKKSVSRTVGPRPGPWTYCPPLKNFMTWTYSPFTANIDHHKNITKFRELQEIAWTPHNKTQLAVQGHQLPAVPDGHRKVKVQGTDYQLVPHFPAVDRAATCSSAHNKTQLAVQGHQLYCCLGVQNLLALVAFVLYCFMK
ncbi:hypothetical protein J6590_086958 [Homalodisca vitripennis]|nr:hypothetical protein J6590_086958 [Homalodisca vitripennis]